MKYLIPFIFIYSFSYDCLSQPDSAIGKIIYLEGKVQLKASAGITPATINTLLYKNQYIITLPSSTAEIQWTNTGTKTVVEPASNYSINDLYLNNKTNSTGQHESIFAGFKKIFRAASESKRIQYSGIRRSKSVVDSLAPPQQLDWIEDSEMSFEEAANYYEKALYSKAVWALKLFLEQKPSDPMATYATFALGHSYLMLNNSTKAKEIFERFKLQFANETELYKQVEEILKTL